MCEEEYEEHTYFMGDCTCQHERENHGWGNCEVVENGSTCRCEAGWEE